MKIILAQGINDRTFRIEPETTDEERKLMAMAQQSKGNN